MRHCRKCGADKASTEFAPTAKWCRACLTAYQREWRAANPDKQPEYKARYRDSHPDRVKEQRRRRYAKEDRDLMREQQRAWRAANPDKIKGYARNEQRRWAYLLRTHGITREQYETLYSAQGGRCAICRCSLPADIVRKGEQGARPHLDHDHGTGRVRGILCGPCNQALGLLREDPAVLRRAARYLSRAV